MVKIINLVKSKSAEGKEFFSLELQGSVEPVMSQKTNRFYLTARSCIVASTFDEETCKKLIGSTLPGHISKVQSEPYEYAVKETGELITLDYRWEYKPVETPANGEDGDVRISRHLVIG